ncbi:hypothetical protein KP509_31G011800 [Ceratopteris richardii]|uniref:Uncharacterized protein n=1 Tax=Ceratopteris richardii TaxID=49495 RepID=A0A8T2QW49_CERRI|nr:hypothetical protein KP509_31G011800 [Ceratopteris richardii]
MESKDEVQKLQLAVGVAERETEKERDGVGEVTHFRETDAPPVSCGHFGDASFRSSHAYVCLINFADDEDKVRGSSRATFLPLISVQTPISAVFVRPPACHLKPPHYCLMRKQIIERHITDPLEF